jgi:hypothetical protein
MKMFLIKKLIGIDLERIGFYLESICLIIVLTLNPLCILSITVTSLSVGVCKAANDNIIDILLPSCIF